MEQVLLNLLTNAKDTFQKPSNGITIFSYHKNNNFVIETYDKGKTFQQKTIKRYLILFLHQSR